MKKFIFLWLITLWFTGCGPKQSDPEKIVWAFLHAYYANDYEGALPYADEETYAELSRTLELLRAEGITMEEMKAAAQPVIIEIEGIVVNDGNQAVCAYKLKNSPNDHNAMMETLLLNKTDKGWKVTF